MTKPVIGTVKALQLQNAILKRALKWYADDKTWTDNMSTISTIGHDHGRKARRALARAEQVKP